MAVTKESATTPTKNAPGDLRQLIRWARQHFGVGSAAAVTCDREMVDFIAVAGNLDDAIPCRRALCIEALRQRRPFQNSNTGQPAANACTSCPVFCAGVPITSAKGELLGGVYVFDSKPHSFGVVDMEVLKCLAELVRRSVDGSSVTDA